MQLLTLTSRYGKFNQENMYQTISESALFCRPYCIGLYYRCRAYQILVKEHFCRSLNYIRQRSLAVHTFTVWQPLPVANNEASRALQADRQASEGLQVPAS